MGALIADNGRCSSRRWERSWVISLLRTVVGDLVAENGRCRSRCWERSWVLSLLKTVAVALVAGSVCGCSRRWERSMLLSLLGAFVGDLVAGNGRCCSRCWDRLWVLSSEAVVSEFCWERLLVAFVGSGRRCRWLSSEAVFGAFFGRTPAMVIELSLLFICELVCTKHVATE